ncbi:family 78 glycoside hydrolase catalytic domain [Jiangella alkaliphila]|uniref:alpha-L-rhamnosidase n=1 Tax=Jiangella alkaliphila TaxID=419479 RepID=A0A1H2LK28_9ACTN|nr:family 78 glycoside hydrolase catalytic domain [Jiangella alkaliphila]SDU81212.1 alpha-L-rhamnosidase [Jiangella alkaliphila]
MNRFSRRALPGLAAGAVLLSLLVPATEEATAAPRSHVTVGGLEVDGMADPLGTGVGAPTLSWRLESDRRSERQSAYEIQVASTEELLTSGEPDLWASGRVIGPAQSVTFGGEPLGSRDRAVWRVRVWDGDGGVSRWSAPGSWEVGLLEPSDWSADWVMHPGFDPPSATPVVVPTTPTSARYVRLEVSRLGLPLREGFPYDVSRLQLAELRVREAAAPDTNLAAGRPVTANRSYVVAGSWEPRFLTDGKLDTDGAPLGYTSLETRDPDVGADPMWVEIDLGATRAFDQIVLYPRTDTLTADGRTPNFPVDYRVLAADAPGGTGAVVVAAVTGQQPPAPRAPEPATMPIFARGFDLPGDVASARLYVTGLGVFTPSLNGEPVSDTVLDPANTDYEDRVTYSTFDVTDALREGENVLGVRLGNGIYNVPSTPGRYQKLVASYGPPKLIAQLEVVLDDGRVITVDSGEDWSTTFGGTTFSGWYGGEDFDARKVPAGWDVPGTDRGDWEQVELTGPPAETTELSARYGPGIEVVDRIEAASVTTPAPGVHVFDLGVNIAGWPELTVDVPAGTSVQLWPGEQLTADGRVSQSTTGAPIWDTYTAAGTGREVWHPEFSYHGFRYVEVRGPAGATPPLDTVAGLVLRAANEEAGSFTSSNALLNGIHRIIDRAVQGNMYSVLTDCPHREKLGWLEETHLVWETVARGYDVAAYGRDLTRTMADAQTPEGLVPDIAPEYTVFSGGFRDDPNWGSAIIHVPWKMYSSYGDASGLRPFYPSMQRYLDYLAGKAEEHLLDYGLGDWITFDPSTPVGVTATFGYHQAARTMARIAEVLGEDDDARRYAQLADDIGAAFHAEYFDAERGTYASGSQASDALALDMGVVPPADRERVLAHLLASIQAADHHLTVGEIALPSVIRVLHENGHDDVMYRIATQVTSPSYGYQVLNGATSLTENWDGPTSGNSQNHFMLGAIDEWFTGALAGIGQREGSTSYRDLEIAPSVVGDLTQVEGRYATPFGEVVSSWQQRNRLFELDVQVPVGSTARVLVPVFGDPDDPRWQPIASPGARFAGIEGDRAVFEVGSGSWTFRSRLPEPAADPAPMLFLTAPAEVAVVGDGERVVPLTVRSIEAGEVSVPVRVTAGEGFVASAAPSRLVVPAGGTATLELTVRAVDPAATSGSVVVDVGGRATTIRLERTDNVARIATMSASSTYPRFSAAKANDGDTAPSTDFARWDSGGGWNDNTASQFPDTLTATWEREQDVSRVRVHTLDAAAYPAARFGLRDWDVEGLVDGAWVRLASVRGNTLGTAETTFGTVAVSALRLVIQGTNDGAFSRVVELEAYS